MASILLIDDDPDVRDSIAKVMVREGFDVAMASNAQEGLDMLTEQKFDILIVDLIMPEMNGVHAIRQARECNPDIKIVAISGGGNFGPQGYRPEAITTTAYLEAAADAGADSVLTKPFERAEIVATVNQFVEPD